MNKISDIDAAYIAGIIDGEGTIAVNRRKPDKRNGPFYNYTPRIRVAMTSKNLVLWLQGVTGLGGVSYYKARNSKYLDQWEWNVTGHSARLLAQRISPFLKIKNLQTINLLSVFNYIGRPGSGGHPRLTKEIVAAREFHHQVSRALNSPQSVPFEIRVALSKQRDSKGEYRGCELRS